jgi:DNA-binding transcriptional MocR family regulator
MKQASSLLRIRMPTGIWEAGLAAMARGVEVVPLSIYSRAPMQKKGLQMGFAAVNVAEIRRGVQQLAIALEELIRKKKTGTPLQYGRARKAGISR